VSSQECFFPLQPRLPRYHTCLKCSINLASATALAKLARTETHAPHRAYSTVTDRHNPNRGPRSGFNLRPRNRRCTPPSRPPGPPPSRSVPSTSPAPRTTGALRSSARQIALPASQYRPDGATIHNPPSWLGCTVCHATRRTSPIPDPHSQQNPEIPDFGGRKGAGGGDQWIFPRCLPLIRSNALRPYRANLSSTKL
jgi:hypothetical protein